jgi:hypothetical protein
MRKPSVSLAIADTESYVLANNAINACLARFDFASVHVLTDVLEYWPQHKCLRIPKIRSIEDYNRVILEALPQVVEHDFCIVSQFDGFILNADAFSEDFYKYDYIGAVWPQFPYLRVGNGGFSWRSKKLMDAVASLCHLRQANEAEDVFICRTLRVMLETRHGCVFADESVANRFSYEIAPDARHAFGFHGVFNLPLVYRDDLDYLVENLPLRILETRMAYLRYGVNLLGSSHAAKFEMLTAGRLKLEPVNGDARS